MNPILPNPPSGLAMSPARRRQIERLEQSGQRQMPIPDKLGGSVNRRYRRDRIAEMGDRLKAYDMRTGHDRRKAGRDQPSIEIDV